MSKTRRIDLLLDELAGKKAQINARIETLSAQRRLSQKKDEDRIKWILGTLVFDRLSAEPALQEWVQRELPERLNKRDHDRELWRILFPDAPSGTPEGRE